MYKRQGNIAINGVPLNSNALNCYFATVATDPDYDEQKVMSLSLIHISEPTRQAEISRKVVKRVPLKLSEYLDKNASYNDEEQLIGFNLNCCTRTCNSANNPRPFVENRLFDTDYGGTLSPHAQTFKVSWMHNRTVKQNKLSRWCCPDQ